MQTIKETTNKHSMLGTYCIEICVLSYCYECDNYTYTQFLIEHTIEYTINT